MRFHKIEWVNGFPFFVFVKKLEGASGMALPLPLPVVFLDPLIFLSEKDYYYYTLYHEIGHAIQYMFSLGLSGWLSEEIREMHADLYALSKLKKKGLLIEELLKDIAKERAPIYGTSPEALYRFFKKKLGLVKS